MLASVLTATATGLQALLMTGDLGREVVLVRFASTVVEGLAGLTVLVEVPFREVTLARASLLRLIAGICNPIKNQFVHSFSFPSSKSSLALEL